MPEEESFHKMKLIGTKSLVHAINSKSGQRFRSVIEQP